VSVFTAGCLPMLSITSLFSVDNGVINGEMRIGRGKPKYSEKSCLSDTSSITDLTLPDLGSNLGSRCEKPMGKPSELWHGPDHLSNFYFFFVFLYLCQPQDDKYVSSVNKSIVSLK
jgi:hypothetical protein